jgi:hypothetical protein
MTTNSADTMFNTGSRERKCRAGRSTHPQRVFVAIAHQWIHFDRAPLLADRGYRIYPESWNSQPRVLQSTQDSSTTSI